MRTQQKPQFWGVKPQSGARNRIAVGFAVGVACTAPSGRVEWASGSTDLGVRQPSLRALRLSRQGLDLVDYLVMFREAADVVLAPDLRAVDVNVEDAAAALDQFGFHLEFALDRLRQTGGCGQVVSFTAVLDGDVHCLFPP